MTVIGQRLQLRLFLEGVEIPVISATVQSQVNAPAACSIQIPVNDFALDFKPRTLVHLFFSDLYGQGPSGRELTIGGTGITNQNEIDPDVRSVLERAVVESTDEQSLTDLESEGYRLLFGGEIMGFSFTKVPTSRSIVLQCVDWSSYWDIAFQYQNGGNLFGPGMRAAMTGASSNLFNSFLDGSGDIVYRLFSTPPRGYPNLQGTLLGGVMHIIESVGGIYYGQRAIRGYNDFFSLAEMRLHLTQMVAANPYSERDERRLLSAQGFGSIFSRSLSGLGKQVSIRNVLLALQKYIFHEIVPITTPRYIPPLYDPAHLDVRSTTLTAEPDLRPIADAAEAIKQKALELQQRLSSATDNATAQAQTPRDLSRQLQRLATDCDYTNRRARRLLLASGTGGQLRYTDQKAAGRITAIFAIAGSSFNNITQLLEGRSFQLPPTSSPDNARISALLTQIVKMMDEAKTIPLMKRQPRTTAQPSPPARLFTQIYRPDVWMVSPPRCNVIFPELYSSLQYGRDYGQEPTRFMLRTHDAFLGSDMLFDGFYFAPSRLTGARTGRRMSRGRTGVEPPDRTDAPAGLVRDLMDHELFTGIIPVFERMSDINLHALGGGFIEIDGVRYGYAQLASNHIFFQKRFQSRQLMVSGKFNPYVVLGFPALVIDNYLKATTFSDPQARATTSGAVAQLIRDGEGEYSTEDPEERERIRQANDERYAQARTSLTEDRPLTHYLGTPQLIVHSVSAAQATGETQIQMGYARTTNEKTEFLGDNVAVARTARRTRNARITTVVAALEPPRSGAKGIRGGQIVGTPVDVTEQYQRRSRYRTSTNNATAQTQYTGGTRLPLYIPDRTYSGRRRRATQVPVGVTQAASAYGPEVVAIVGTGGSYQSASGVSQTMVTFRAYRITEEIGVYSREPVELPPEQLTFPPWYGEHYRSQNIGGLYGYYFGTGSITDPTTISGSGATSSPRGVGDPSGKNAAQVDLVAGLDSEIGTFTDSGSQPGVPAMNIPGGNGVAGPPGQPSGDTLGEIEARSPISTAVDELVRIYSQIKHRHYDVDQFIKSYTWRPIASMVDLFGTANLEINDRGEVTRGVEGFHSRAFGDYDDLRTLISPGEHGQPSTILGLHVYDPDQIDNPGAQPSGDSTISARLDTRKEKRIQVLKYLHGLIYTRGVG